MKSTESNLSKLVTAGAVFGALSGSAFAAAPIDLTGTGTELAGYVGTAATGAIVIFVALVAIRLILRAFKAVK